MRKIILSGGPNSGKTTLLNALRLVYPDSVFLPEPAKSLIQDELAKQARDKDYVPLLPWTDGHGFNETVFLKYLAQEATIPRSDGLSFQDRGLIDSLAYCLMDNDSDLAAQVKQKIAQAQYYMVFFCELVGGYTQDSGIRRETEEEAQEKHRILRETYKKFDLVSVNVPAVSTEERIKIISASLS